MIREDTTTGHDTLALAGGAASSQALSVLSLMPMRRGLSLKIAISPRSEHRLRVAGLMPRFRRSLVDADDAVLAGRGSVSAGVGILLLVLATASP